MANQLILYEPETPGSKNIGESIFIDNLPYNFKVYALYYPSAMGNEDLENRLRNLGNLAGQNLFVNIGKLNDPKFGEIVNKFKIVRYPVIIITAISELASIPNELSTVYVRIDDKRLLNSPESAVECVQIVFTFFLERKMSAALDQVKSFEHSAIISHIEDTIMVKLSRLHEILKGSSISISLIEGKFELKWSDG